MREQDYNIGSHESIGATGSCPLWRLQRLHNRLNCSMAAAPTYQSWYMEDIPAVFVQRFLRNDEGQFFARQTRETTQKKFALNASQENRTAILMFMNS